MGKSRAAVINVLPISDGIRPTRLEMYGVKTSRHFHFDRAQSRARLRAMVKVSVLGTLLAATTGGNGHYRFRNFKACVGVVVYGNVGGGESPVKVTLVMRGLYAPPNAR